MKFLIAAALLLSPVPAFGFDTPVDVYTEIEPILSRYPSLTEVEICVEGECDVFTVVAFERKGGKAETMYERPKGGGDGNETSGGGAVEAVGGILGQIGGKVGVGGKVTVSYEHSKNKDGSEKTSVKVEITAGAGSAAEGAVQK